MERRLAAILAADVVGYSRLMGEDEAGTLEALRHLRREVFNPAVDNHKGTLIKSMGDGWLVEFASVADGVGCAVRIQEALAGLETVKLRIGLHIGDITFEEEDIYGDGVNVASRLQELAEPGAIVISGSARSGIDGKLSAGFANLGAHELKNIAAPVAAFGWGMKEVSREDVAVPLPDKPSIAVLPFDNMSGNPGNDHICDGLTETIIGALAKLSSLTVIARNSTFIYRGRAVDIRKVARETGARYVLEGSVQMSEQRVRVTAQLIDSATSAHLWSENYDRGKYDLFDVFDEITLEIVAALDIELVSGEQSRLRYRMTRSLDAIGEVSRGGTYFYRYTKEDNVRAIRHFERATEIDPNFASAYGYIAWAHWIDVLFGFAANPKISTELAIENLEKARALNENLPEVYALTCSLLSRNKRYDEAYALGQKAIGMFPNGAELHAVVAVVATTQGLWSEAVRLFKTAIRLEPHYQTWYLNDLATACFFSGDLDDALMWVDKGVARAESDRMKARFLARKAAILAEAGKVQEARITMTQGQDIMPMNIEQERQFYNFKDERDLEHLFSAYRRAGMPER